ncbi:hypothetical protein BOW53_09310 [Solemya pervernicosa gill symbiont]|uniref:DUF2782 domain-containing protein n=2 Tax=Gammaproteobacteria incertae sedis TaxID=118884 RepID=A0A1T2L4M6_9GAMM|nr:DUF2782 domain-containing protein [Candidatus Reidiella endopervernicosa]OOZ40024.1 hypothetical protein BOW53_09310 [Solemya pervernicosa gill symbiont]QKQ25309.1 DUF2782 domain-containing protein [Candidatus Reidiella endopervernicosa]
MTTRLLPLIALLALSTSVTAQPPELEPVPEPPALPSSVESGETLEPEITIRTRGDETVKEYRVNGHLYMVKITPMKGVTYYLVDTDGDGRLDRRSEGLENDMVIPGWVLMRW